VIVQVIPRQSEADRKRAYRARGGDDVRAREAARMRKSRAKHIPEFVGVDSEGIGRGKNHRAVLLGVGTEQYVAADIERGLVWDEVFEFLYGQFERKPNAAFVGFYLKYDFVQWLKSLPFKPAWMLLSPKGKALRKMTQPNGKRRTYHPVRVDGWEIDMLGMKRLSIRPRVCQCAEQLRVCTHTHKPWMHICDAGSFYQMTFLQVCDPEIWQDDPDGPICTDSEYAQLKRGKDKRAVAKLDDDMKFYNQLENVLLARAMERLCKGFIKVGIRLAKDEWYGPGASAGKWLKQHGSPKHKDAVELMPDWFLKACANSYYGGWFEIFSHGLIYGESYNYDINNAYPFATTKLPHICGECSYRRGHGNYKGTGKYVLVSATVRAKGNRIGPVPYRDTQSNILRPGTSRGWYWLGEIQAATRAGLVATSKTEYHEWVEFIPCDHPKPFTEVEDLYYERLRVGKNSAQGMSIKLNNNSLYGKFAQSAGSAPFNNWFYASLITSYCRTQILDAIATHPGGPNSVLMVATDGIAFDSPHPTLPVSKKLGEWDATTYTDLCLFKPGVYWHKVGKEQLLKAKTRGVPKAEFVKEIKGVELLFAKLLELKKAPGEWDLARHIDWSQIDFEVHTDQAWPWFQVPINFRLKSLNQALNEGEWSRAGLMQEKIWVGQDSDPQNKRANPVYNARKKRIDTHIHNLPADQIQTKFYLDTNPPQAEDRGVDFDGESIAQIESMVSTLRNTNSPASAGEHKYDNEYQWIEVR
jgi:hypothetical protein